MVTRLWYMNADFETELAAPRGKYRRSSFFEQLNWRLAPRLLWLASPGDALLIESPASTELLSEAARRGVEIVTAERATNQRHRVFTPWGWTKSAVALGEQVGAITEPLSLELVARVNSKLWSHQLEHELGVALPGAVVASMLTELNDAAARACPKPDDKWVIKSPFGFAARERVLGRGAIVAGPQATWARRRLTMGETLIFQPWLDVIREYGIVMDVFTNGEVKIHGISDLQTNGAGTGTGYLLGRGVAPHRRIELERMARIVGARLRDEGYVGPAGVDALEHRGGLHPLLEVNARYTMGFVALAVERALRPATPILWDTKEEPPTYEERDAGNTASSNRN
ncbi:MAG: hypothetical protein M3430_02385 [Acidobacteriota bacterium]|nr:hypothetical protein [Acidobacteriota bacterium]